MQSFFEFLVSVINHYHINGLHLFWNSFEWFCLQISSDAKYFFLPCPRYCNWELIVVIVYYFQIWNKKKNTALLLVELLTVTWVPCILRLPIYITTYCKMFYPIILFCRLPEIPPDTAETNAVMRFKEHPKFSAITPQDIVLGCAKLAIVFETKLGNHIKNLKGKFSFDFHLKKKKKLRKMIEIVHDVFSLSTFSLFSSWLIANSTTGVYVCGFRSLVEVESTYWGVVKLFNTQNKLMDVHQSDISKILLFFFHLKLSFLYAH